MTLQYIYADLPVGKEVGSLCIISSLLFFLAIFFRTFIPRLSSQFTPSLSLVVACCSFSHSLTLAYPFALHRFLSARIGLRRTSFARGSETQSEIAIRIDFFSVVTFFLVHVIHICVSLLSSIRFYLPAWFNSSEQKRSPVEIARFRGFNDGRIKDTWLPTRFYTIHNFVGFHLSPHEPPSLPSLVAHPPPNSRLLRIFREVLSSTLLNL